MWLRRLRTLVPVLALLSQPLGARVASAAPTEAERRAAREFVEGQRAFEAGDFVRAAESFEAAYRDKPHHSPLWNAARSWHRAGEVVRAANLYARYLREAPADARDRDQATASLREASATVGRVEVVVPSAVDKARLDGRDVDAPAIYVAPGEHVAEGLLTDKGGKAIRKVVSVAAGQTVSVTLAVEDEPRKSTVIFQPVPAAPDGGARVLPPIVVVVGGALTAISGGLTVASGLDTVSKKDAFLGDQTQPRLDDAFSSQTRTNVLLGTTIGLAVVTGVVALVFTDWKGKPAQAEVARRHPAVGAR